MAGATPADPQVSGTKDPNPNDVNAAAITQLAQRVGAGTVMAPSLPNDVNAPAVTYHTPVTTPAAPAWGDEAGGPGGIYVPPLVDPDLDDGLSAPVQGGNEGQVVTTSIPAPVQANAVGSTTGGTLAAGTYFYVITALDDLGESTASNEESATTTGTTSSVALSWTDVDDAQADQGYNIYRGTATGAENKLIGNVDPGTFAFTDTGTAGTTATVPSSNTTASAYPTRTNVVNGAGSNPYPNDVNAVAITTADPTSGGRNVPVFPDGAPSSAGDQSPT